MKMCDKDPDTSGVMFPAHKICKKKEETLERSLFIDHNLSPSTARNQFALLSTSQCSAVSFGCHPIPKSTSPGDPKSLSPSLWQWPITHAPAITHSSIEMVIDSLGNSLQIAGGIDA